MEDRYQNFDDEVHAITGNGCFTDLVSPREDYDLLGMREYCKQHGKQMHELTDEERKRFIRLGDKPIAL